jgi:REP element-mobilizing transposase RayT
LSAAAWSRPPGCARLPGPGPEAHEVPPYVRKPISEPGRRAAACLPPRLSDCRVTHTSAKTKPLPQRKSPRLRGFDYPACYAYSITICTRDRVPHFLDKEAGREVACSLEDEARRSGYSLIAYCVMPDHIHILTGPNDRAHALTLPQFMQRFKSSSTRRLWKLGIRGVVWQTSYFDHVLRRDEDLEQVARYILGNPVRKGLVRDPEAYPLSRSFSGKLT